MKKLKQDADNNDYVLLDLHDFIKLNSLIKCNEQAYKTNLTLLDLLFLAGVLSKLSEKCNCDLTVCNNRITIHQENDKINNEITFNVTQCKYFYDNITEFINRIS